MIIGHANKNWLVDLAFFFFGDGEIILAVCVCVCVISKYFTACWFLN